MSRFKQLLMRKRSHLDKDAFNNGNVSNSRIDYASENRRRRQTMAMWYVTTKTMTT